MQLSRIYSNKPDIFTDIEFHCRDDSDKLNVIFGDVRRPKDVRKDSHNLGKTTLLHLIEFMMLKGTSPEQFLVKHIERFKAFEFFLEIALNAGDYATIRRRPAEPTRIALARHPERGRDFANEPDDAFDHFDMPIAEAVTLLDSWLDLRILSPYDFRQAITYFLRAQGDYSDELQLQKFRLGKDRAWKPFVAHLFGFKEAAIRRKYDLDDEIDDLKKQMEHRQSEVQYKEDQLPELNATINALGQNVGEIEARIDAFQFDTEERRIMTAVVEELEGGIAATNEALYNIRYDKQQIQSALSHSDKFNLNEVEAIFKEASVNFPDQLKRQYEDLVDFNRRVTRERGTALRARLKDLEREEESLLERKVDLDRERSGKLKTLRSTDTFEKFKTLQKDLSEQRAQLVYLEEQRKRVQQVADVARKMREAERDRGRVVDEIKALVEAETPIYRRFQSIFNSYCQRILNHDAVFYFRVNSNNNFDYEIGLALPGRTGVASSLSDGTSYKKLICALFDLALLKVHENAPFFHFVYHDGVMEGLDNRKKKALLALIRDTIGDGKIQYILTLIKSDLPRDEDDKAIEFAADEIVLRLHDEGNEGRLFKMAEF